MSGEFLPDHTPLTQVSYTARMRILAFLVLPVIALGITGLHSGQDTAIFVLSLLLYCVLCLPFLARRTYTLVEPFTVLFGMLYIGLPLKLGWALAFRDSPKFVYYMQGQPIETLIMPAVLSLLGVSALCIGYTSGQSITGKTKPFRFPDREWNTKLLFCVCGIALAISTIVFIFYARRAGISFRGNGPISAKRIEAVADGPMGRGSLAYYRWGISLAQIVFYLIFAWSLKRRLGRRGVMLLGVILTLPLLMSFMMPFVTSSRTPLIFFLLECLIILYCLKDDVFTGKWLTAQLVSCVVVVSLFMFILALRGDPNAEKSRADSMTPVALAEHVVGARYLADITKTGQIYHAIPNFIPFQRGTSYTAVLFAPIPRDVWPGKPAIGLGPFIGKEIYGLDHTGVPPGMIGEAYLNFGWPGVAVIPFLFGCFVRWSYEKLRGSL
ncbi:MAG: O-antigen polymerase, partial [Rubripirellula sp.]